MRPVLVGRVVLRAEPVGTRAVPVGTRAVPVGPVGMRVVPGVTLVGPVGMRVVPGVTLVGPVGMWAVRVGTPVGPVVSRVVRVGTAVGPVGMRVVPEDIRRRGREVGGRIRPVGRPGRTEGGPVGGMGPRRTVGRGSGGRRRRCPRRGIRGGSRRIRVGRGRGR
ncbi:hypothetical protein ABGB17_10170 [Sphaerisporangium sp. B11E5]|uniref:hypothetical protein n=1 Tax=Sphaerisporangium sp. B11E5 TaxID=3153563 RepID=UPI00325C90EC